MEDELQRAQEEEDEKKLLSRNVVPVLKVQVMGTHSQDVRQKTGKHKVNTFTNLHCISDIESWLTHSVLKRNSHLHCCEIMVLLWAVFVSKLHKKK